MKKIIAILGLSVSLISCQEKLPANIDSALYSYEFAVKCGDPTDSLVISLNQQSIDKLTVDSITTIISTCEYYREKQSKAAKELDELLKYNPEYSDYDKIKNKRSQYRWTSDDLYRKNYDYMEGIINHEMDAEYYPKPVYGKQ